MESSSQLGCQKVRTRGDRWGSVRKDCVLAYVFNRRTYLCLPHFCCNNHLHNMKKNWLWCQSLLSYRLVYKTACSTLSYEFLKYIRNWKHQIVPFLFLMCIPSDPVLDNYITICLMSSNTWGLSFISPFIL